MSRLFVANCTRQNKEVYYRLDFNEEGKPNNNARFQPAKKQTIPPGRQINLGGDLHIKQIEDIVDQLARYGLKGVADLPRIKTSTPYLFDIDKAIKPDAIRQVMNINSGILVDQGKVRRRKAAIVVNETVANTVTNEFANAGIPKEPTQQVETELEQLEQSEAGESRIEEGFKIDASAPHTQERPKSGRGSRGGRLK